MEYDPATTGEAPITWRQGPDPSPDPPPRGVERILGFGAADIGTAQWLPDDPESLGAAIAHDGRPFNGAFVPLVIHDPVLAERSYDAAEWAADLIRSTTGQCFCVTPFADKGWVAEKPLSPRQWNHTAAMIERLDELCKRYRLRALVSDRVGGQPVRPEGALDPELPIHFVLDAGNFLNDGYLPATLVSPERIEQGGHTVSRFPGQ